MLRSATVGLVSVIALGVSLAAAPSAATAGQFGAGAGGMRSGGNMGGGAVHGSNMGGSAIRGGNVGGSNMMVIRSDFSSGRVVQHDMDHNIGHDLGHDIGHDLGRMRMADHDHDRDRDRDHDRDRRDHDRFRFFPAFAFGVDTYSDYDPDYSCFELHRVWTHAGWRLRRVWVCD